MFLQKIYHPIFTPIDEPFTEYSAIKELLKCSENATNEVGQKYMLSTFDLGGCMKTLPLIWSQPKRYQMHIVTLGAFHTAMNFIRMITNKKCRGSGYAEILIEVQLTPGGSIGNVLQRKAYIKALFCLKTICEDMGKTLFALQQLLQNCCQEIFSKAMEDLEIRYVIKKYVLFENKVWSGSYGKTATVMLKRLRTPT